MRVCCEKKVAVSNHRQNWRYFVPCRLIAEASRYHIDTGAYRFALPDILSLKVSSAKGDEYVFGIRPEKFQHPLVGNSQTNDLPAIKARINVIEIHGKETFLDLSAGERYLMAMLDADIGTKTHQDIKEESDEDVTNNDTETFRALDAKTIFFLIKRRWCGDLKNCIFCNNVGRRNLLRKSNYSKNMCKREVQHHESIKKAACSLCRLPDFYHYFNWYRFW